MLSGGDFFPLYLILWSDGPLVCWSMLVPWSARPSSLLVGWSCGRSSGLPLLGSWGLFQSAGPKASKACVMLLANGWGCCRAKWNGDVLGVRSCHASTTI